MDPDEKALHESIIIEYRNRLDAMTFDLARANAQIQVKDRIITELQALIPAEETDPESTDLMLAPKPGPPKAN